MKPVYIINSRKPKKAHILNGPGTTYCKVQNNTPAKLRDFMEIQNPDGDQICIICAFHFKTDDSPYTGDFSGRFKQLSLAL